MVRWDGDEAKSLVPSHRSRIRDVRAVCVVVHLCRATSQRDSLVVCRTFGWITLGSYTLVSAGVTTLGRLGLGGHGPFISIWNIHSSLDCGVGLSCSHCARHLSQKEVAAGSAVDDPVRFHFEHSSHLFACGKDKKLFRSNRA